MNNLEPFMDDESMFLQLSQDAALLSTLYTEIAKELHGKNHLLYGPMASLFAIRDARVEILKKEAKRTLSKIMFFIAFDEDIQPDSNSLLDSGNDIMKALITSDDSFPSEMKDEVIKIIDKLTKNFKEGKHSKKPVERQQEDADKPIDLRMDFQWPWPKIKGISDQDSAISQTFQWNSDDKTPKSDSTKERYKFQNEDFWKKAFGDIFGNK